MGFMEKNAKSLEGRSSVGVCMRGRVEEKLLVADGGCSLALCLSRSALESKHGEMKDGGLHGEIPCG